MSEELVLELFKVLAESLLLLSRLLELLHQLLPVKKRQKHKTNKQTNGSQERNDDRRLRNSAVEDSLEHICGAWIWNGDLRGGGVQVGQSHVRRLRRGQLIHGRNEAVHVFLYVVQKAEHTDVGVDAHGKLRL